MAQELQDQVLANISALLSRARASQLDVLFIQHDGPKGHPIEVNTPDWAIPASIRPLDGEPVIHKRASDSFFETKLAEELQSRRIKHLIIVGGMTEYCIDTTCRRAYHSGLRCHARRRCAFLSRYPGTDRFPDHRASQSRARRFCRWSSFDQGQTGSAGFPLTEKASGWRRRLKAETRATARLVQAHAMRTERQIYGPLPACP